MYCLIALNICAACATYLGDVYQRTLPEKGINFEPRTVQVDSSAAEAHVLNKQVSAKSKHINLKYSFKKAALKIKMIFLKDLKSVNMTADLLTKALELPNTLLITRKICLIRHRFLLVLQGFGTFSSRCITNFKLVLF